MSTQSMCSCPVLMNFGLVMSTPSMCSCRGEAAIGPIALGGARLVAQAPRSHPFRGAPPLKGCGTPSRVRHPFRGAAPLEGRRTPDAAPQGVRAAACGKPLQSSSGSRGSAGRGFLFVVSLFFVVFCVMGKSNFAGSCFLEVRRVRI